MVTDIWRSFRALPLWVQLWVFGLLVPVNLASLFFWWAPHGWGIALLAVGGMVPNAVLMFVERGFSKGMAISHVILWTPLVPWIAALLYGGGLSGGQVAYLWLLLGVDLLSLGFDYRDCLHWSRGDRAVAGR